jgi:hypothetical protein
MYIYVYYFEKLFILVVYLQNLLNRLYFFEKIENLKA